MRASGVPSRCGARGCPSTRLPTPREPSGTSSCARSRPAFLSSSVTSSASTSRSSVSVRIVVTGAAGFIGANLVKALNRRGVREIVAVDNLARADKVVNLVDCEIEEFVDKDEFLTRLTARHFDGDVGAVLDQGACSDTMEADGRYVMRNNYRYSVTLLDWCQSYDVPLLYASSASVYGGSATFREERAFEAPLNVYGYSKFLFDQHVRRLMPERTAQIAGFRYFNVYGPREQHKGRGSSVAWHFCQQYREHGHVSLFAGSGGFAAG